MTPAHWVAVLWTAAATSAPLADSRLGAFSDEVAALGKRVSPAVVFVSVEKVVPSLRGLPGFDQSTPMIQKGVGSGFLIDVQAGYLMTNHHVVEGADSIQVKLANGDSTAGRVVGRDPNTDLAVVKLEKFRKDGLAQLTFADSEQIKVGELAIAVGAPYGLEASMSLGIVSAVGRGSLGLTELGDFLQTDAAINPGNSGGPLLNTRGEVVGVNTAIFSQSGGSSGIGFAIPSNLAKLVGERLVRDGRVRRGYAGASLQPLDQALREEFKAPSGTTGVVVSSVVPDGPSAKADLRPGDIVTTVEGQPMDSVSELVNWIAFQDPGKVVHVDILREGKVKRLAIKLEEWPAARGEAPSAPSNEISEGFGLVLARVTAELRERFEIASREAVLVVRVAPGSAAERAGLEPGDAIVSVGGEPASTPEKFLELTKGKDQILVRLERQSRFFFTVLRRSDGLAH